MTILVVPEEEVTVVFGCDFDMTWDSVLVHCRLKHKVELIPSMHLE